MHVCPCTFVQLTSEHLLNPVHRCVLFTSSKSRVQHQDALAVWSELAADEEKEVIYAMVDLDSSKKASRRPSEHLPEGRSYEPSDESATLCAGCSAVQRCPSSIGSPAPQPCGRFPMPRVTSSLPLQSICHHRHEHLRLAHTGLEPCMQMYTYAVPDSDDCHEHIIGFVSSGYTLLVSSVNAGA